MRIINYTLIACKQLGHSSFIIQKTIEGDNKVLDYKEIEYCIIEIEYIIAQIVKLLSPSTKTMIQSYKAKYMNIIKKNVPI